MLDIKKVWSEDVANHYDYLIRLARYHTGNAESAEDLVQDTFLKAFLKRDKFAEGGNLKAWLTTILKNSWYDELRKKRNRSNTPYFMLQDSTFQEPAPDFDEIDKMDRLLEAVENLDPKFKSIIKQRLEGVKIREIAKERGMSRDTIAARIFRAKKALRKELLIN